MNNKTGPAEPIQSRRTPAAVELIATPLRFSIIISLLISLSGIAWACFARIPIYVNGISYMLALGNVDAINTNTEGRIYYQFSASQLIDKPLFRRLYQITQDQKAIDKSEIPEIAKELLATRVSGPRLELNKIYDKLVPPGRVLAWVDSLANRNHLNERLLSYNQGSVVLANKGEELKQINKKINAKLSILRQQVDSEKEYLDKISSLFKTGYASRENVLRQKARVDDIRTTIISYMQEIADNDQKQIENEMSKQQALISLRSDLIEFIDGSFLFAKTPLYIVDMNSSQYSLVRAEDTVMRVSATKLSELPDQIPGYLSQSDAQQISTGMAVLVTPMGMDRAQFGGIIGKVHKVNILPSSLQQIAERIGSLAIAKEVSTMIPNPVRVDLILQRDPHDKEPNHRGFRWSSPGSPPFPISTGSQLNLQITAQRVSPISLLIPFMLKSSGVSPPSSSPRRQQAIEAATQGAP